MQEYAREDVFVHPLSPLIPLLQYTLPAVTNTDVGNVVPVAHTPLPPVSEMPSEIQVQTYIFREIQKIDQERGIWTFDDFCQTNAWKWSGNELEKRDDILQVDMIRTRLDTLRESA